MTDPSARPPTVSHPGTDTDVAALRALVGDVESGFNDNDPDLLVGGFIENGSAVNVMGVQLDGRAAMLAAAQAGLAGPLHDEYAAYDLVDITFLRPDVAVGHKHARATDEFGDPIDVGHSMVALYVFVKEGDRWWVAARQNTLVPRP